MNCSCFQINITWKEISMTTVLFINFRGFRGLWLFYFLMQFNLHEAVEVTVVRNKAIGTSGDTFRMTGKCMYRVSEPAEKAELTIELDKPTFKFKVCVMKVSPT